MRCLLDTHALIWWWTEDKQLSVKARTIMADRANIIMVSAATGWEMATKVRAGRLPEMIKYIANFGSWVEDDGFRHLDVRHEHGLKGGLLEGLHRDPFDRLIAAQGIIEGIPVITCDPALAALGCAVIW